MSRSIKKGPYCDPKLIKKVRRLKEAQVASKSNQQIIVKTYARSSTIIPDFIGVTMMIHNGKDFVSLFVSEHLVGFKLGEFAKTRTFRGHSGDRKSK